MRPDPVENDNLRQREVESQILALHSPAAHIRASAARRLGDLQAGMADLIECLQDPAESVRSAAAMSLGRFEADERRQEIIEMLLAAIDDPSERVCQSAIRSLGMLRAETARDEIEALLDETDPFILGSAILALARIGASDLAPRIAGYLQDESSYVKTQAARAMALLKYMPAREVITSLLEKTREERRSRGFEDPSARGDRRESDLYNLQNQLIRAAGDLQITEAVTILIDIAQKDIGFRGLAVEALIAIGADIDPQLLVGLLADPSIFLRKRLIQLITKYNYLPALTLIRPLVHEENITVRAAALQAIVRLKDATALPRIRWMCYHDSNPFIRVQAVHSLAEMLGAGAVQDMIGLAGDANYQVRRTAITYLLEWKQQDPQTLEAFARYIDDYPEDALSIEIPSQYPLPDNTRIKNEDRAPASFPLLPDELREEAGSMLNNLQRWHDELLRAPSPERQAVSSALALLMDILRNR